MRTAMPARMGSKSHTEDWRVDMFTLNGIPTDPVVQSVIKLLSTTTVAFNADADTTLFTVPAGKRCVLTHAIVVAGDDAGATTDLSIGQAAAGTDWVDAITLSNLDAANDAVKVEPIMADPPPKGKSYAATTVIEAKIANQSGGATNTIYLFGFLY